MNIDELNDQFALNGQLRFVTGEGGLVMIELENRHARALISTYSAQVLSYVPAGAADLLFVSEHALFAPGKAIKGGVPVCWPWFGPDPEGKGRAVHGFVRNRQWQVGATEALADGSTRVRLELGDDAETRGIWGRPFHLVLEITVGASLRLELITHNPADQALPITQGLHTYFSVGAIEQMSVVGLEGRGYIDKVHGGERQQDGPVTVSEEVDRVYTGVKGNIRIEDPALGRRILIRSEGSASAVVWNPWIEKSAAMGDFGDDEYLRMVCVETTNAGPDQVEVPAYGEYRLVAEYTAEKA